MYKKILVPIDGSATSNRALDEAIRLAQHDSAELRLIHVVDKLVFAPTVETARYIADMQKALRENGRAIVKRAEAAVRKHNVVVKSMIAEIVGGRAAEPIVSHAAKWPADLIVIGTHGRRGINRLMMGSDAEQVVRTAPVPVLVIRSRTSGR